MADRRPRFALLLVLGGCTWISKGADPDGDGVPNVEDCAPMEAEYAEPQTWYQDLDGDGFGDDGASSFDCYPPQDAAPSAGDCDDADADAWPGAEDVCGDDVDAACDGLPCARSLLESDLVLYGAEGAEGEGGAQLGYALAPLRDINGDGLADLVVGATSQDSDLYDDLGPGGAAYVLFGPLSTGEHLAPDVADLTLIGPAEGQAGKSFAGDGDLDDDGLPDLVVGAHRHSGGGALGGAAYVLLGPLSGGSVALDDPSDGADQRWLAERSLSRAGYSLAALDLDGDQADDLVVSGPQHQEGEAVDVGIVYFLQGPLFRALGSAWDRSLAEADGAVLGESASDLLGLRVRALGDLDGDGAEELAVVSTDTANGAGAVYLLASLPGVDEVVSDAARATVRGVSAYDTCGSAVAGAGDADDDGYGDLWVGADGVGDSAQDSGAAYLLRGPLSGTVFVDSAETRVLGQVEGDQLGSGLDGGRDADGDGVADLLVTAATDDEDGVDRGTVYLLTGPWESGSWTAAESGARYIGANSGDKTGVAVAFGGELGPTDAETLLIGAEWADHDGKVDTGALYAIFNAGL